MQPSSESAAGTTSNHSRPPDEPDRNRTYGRTQRRDDGTRHGRCRRRQHTREPGDTHNDPQRRATHAPNARRRRRKDERRASQNTRKRSGNNKRAQNATPTTTTTSRALPRHRRESVTQSANTLPAYNTRRHAQEEPGRAGSAWHHCRGRTWPSTDPRQNNHRCHRPSQPGLTSKEWAD